MPMKTVSERFKRMDRSRDFDTKREAIEYGTNIDPLMATTSPDGQHDYLYNGHTGMIKYSLEINEEGLYYWEIY